MIIPAHAAKRIAAGRASQVRLPVGKPQTLNGGQTVPARCPYEIGQTYAVQRHSVDSYTVEGGTEGTIRNTEPAKDGDTVVVLDVRRTILGDLTLQDIKLEGYADRAEYLDAWRTHRGNDDPARPVWVLRVTRDIDRLRLLTPAGKPTGRLDDHGDWQGSETDYTSSPSQAMLDEPEAVDEKTQQHFSDTARNVDPARFADRVDRVERELVDLIGRNDARVVRKRIETAIARRHAA